MTFKSIASCVILSTAAMASSQTGNVTMSKGLRAEAKRIARAEMQLINGSWELVRSSGWIDLTSGVRPAAFTDAAFDLFEYSFDTDGNVVTDENGAYGASCGLADPTVRWTYTNPTRATFVYNDMNLAPGYAGTKAKRVAFAWQQGVTETLQVGVIPTENFVGSGAGDPNNASLRGDYSGVIIDFGTSIADGIGFYQWADVDISAVPLQLPLDGSGGYILSFRTNNNTAYSTLNSPAFWGTKAGNPSKSTDPVEYQSTTLNNGTFSLPSDQKNMAFSLCPDPLGSMTVFFTLAPTIVAPSAQNVLLSSVKTGNLASLASDDANQEQFCKALVPNLSSPFMRVDLTATSPTATPGFFRFSVKSRMVTAGVFQQTVYLFNAISGTFSKSRVDSVNTSFATRDLYGDAPLSNYVNASDKQIRSRIEVKQTGFSASIVPCYLAEYANWGISL